jgi:Cu(I)/Ag(I) efflux system membrane fusion protein
MNDPKVPLGKRLAWWGLYVVLPIVLLGGAVAYLAHPARDAANVQQADTWWTCSMHPQIRLRKPGLCPICNMDLIPLGDAPSSDSRRFSTSPEAAAMMNIETAPVERKFVSTEVRMVGKVDYDETRLAYITARVAGRLDRLFVDYTGVPVKKGDHLVEIYSPELYAAQQELLGAVKAAKESAGSELAIVRKTADATVQSAREKLRLWGLSAEQIADIESSGKLAEHVTINAPLGGIVIQKDMLQGDYVQTGSRIYTIADLSNVWVKLDAYESDLPWLRYGQKVEFTSVSFPGETFHGTISFINPVLDEKTRTVKVRVDVPNADGRLKPEMFVKATVRANIAAGGKVMDAALAGKWISPMHPEIVKDGPGKCDICGMPLVPAESLGYVATTQPAVAPLVVPATAPLVTGTRAVVYVQVPDAKDPTFDGRQIVLGPRAGDYYIVASGLAEGERVVTRGNFKIDSALQIQARPSMMSSDGVAAPAGGEHEGMDMPASQPAADPAFTAQLGKLLDGYCGLQEALSQDALAPAKAAAAQMHKALADVDAAKLSPEQREMWVKHKDAMAKILADAADAKDLQKLREFFSPLSDELIAAGRHFPLAGDKPLYVIKCPMAFNNRGALWLSRTKEIRNPYFGAQMLTCGDMVETLSTAAN